MKSNNRETLRIRLYSYYEKYKHLGKKFSIDHFISEGEKRTTIYDIINRFESGKNAKHQSGDGPPAKIFNKQARKSLNDWSITKMACPKENSLVAFNAHNHNSSY